jgi:adenosylcobinamide amidohydrolase
MKSPLHHAMRQVSLAALMAVGLAATAHADEREDLETLKQTTLNLIQALVDQGVLPAAKADALVKQAEAKARAAVAEAKKTEQSTVRVQFVPNRCASRSPTRCAKRWWPRPRWSAGAT